MDKSAHAADMIVKDAIARLTIAVGRAGKLAGPPAARVVISSRADNPRRFLADGIEDYLTVVNQANLDLVLTQLDKRRARPGQGSFSFQEQCLGRPWFDIHVDIHVDTLILSVSQIHPIAGAKAAS